MACQPGTMETAKSLVAMRTRAELEAGKVPGPGGSLGKLFGSVIYWRYREIAMEIAGPASQAWDPADGDLGGPVDTKAAFNNPPYAYGIVERNMIGKKTVCGPSPKLTSSRDT